MNPPTFVTVMSEPGRAHTYGPFWSQRSLRRWLNYREELTLGTASGVVSGLWGRRREVA